MSLNPNTIKSSNVTVVERLNILVKGFFRESAKQCYRNVAVVERLNILVKQYFGG